MPTSKDLRVGIDFGTSGIRVAVGRADTAEVTSVPMREVFDWDGRRVPSTKFPSAVQFGPGDGQYKLLGNRAADEQQSMWEVDTTSSGAKLSLDPTQSKAGDAARFLQLCETYKVEPDRVRLVMLGVVKEKVDAFLAAEYPDESDPWKRVVSTRINIPYIWSSASETASYSRGDAIQNKLLTMMETVGFPNLVTPENEAMSALRYHIHVGKKLLDGLGKKTVRVLLIDAGEGTTDVAPVQLVLVEGTWRVIEIADAQGCSGGTSYIWNNLVRLCQKKRADDGDAATMYHLAQLHFFKMGETFKRFSYGDSTISKEYFERVMENAYEDPLNLAVKEASRIENLDLIMVSGAAFANNSITQFWRERLGSRPKSQSGKAAAQTAPQIVFLDPNDASDAVAKGACLPYDDDPMNEFHKSCFGILIDGRPAVSRRTAFSSRRKRATGRRGRADLRKLLQFKRANSDDFESEFQTVYVRDPNEFLVEPHYLMSELVDLEDENGDDTTTTFLDATSALPMGNLQFNLHGKVRRNEAVGIRFQWIPGRLGSGKLVLLELAAGSWRVTQQLQLVRDVDRVYFVVGEVRELEDDVELGSRTDHDEETAHNSRDTGGSSGGNVSLLEAIEVGLGDIADDGTAYDDEATEERGVGDADGQVTSPSISATLEPPHSGRKRPARAVSRTSETPERGDAGRARNDDQLEHFAEGVASKSHGDLVRTGTDEEASTQTAGVHGETNFVTDEDHEELDDRVTTQNAAIDREQSALHSQEGVDELGLSAPGSPDGEAAGIALPQRPRKRPRMTYGSGVPRAAGKYVSPSKRDGIPKGEGRGMQSLADRLGRTPKIGAIKLTPQSPARDSDGPIGAGSPELLEAFPTEPTPEPDTSTATTAPPSSDPDTSSAMTAPPSSGGGKPHWRFWNVVS